ncbi:MAG: glycosyltransferase [Alphaproteobacteria bacterium]|nr:glycosyltransferase [Alphaproteobacteria bacterium]
MSKVSVIIPVYNTEQFLPQCLNSIIHQTHKNLEIIIVNDGSKDNSDKICQQFAKIDKRIKIIYQTNSGLSAARNTGLKNATGDYIHFIDSDDYIDLDYYEKIISANKGIDADIIAAGVVSQNGSFYNIEYKHKTILTTLTEKFIETNALSNCTVWRYVFKRNFLNKNKLIFANGRIFEDILFTPDAMRLANYVLTVPDTYYHYVFNANSLLNKAYSPKHQEQYKYAAKHLRTFINKYELEERINTPNQTLTIYKIFGLHLIKEIFSRSTKATNYLIFGIPVMKKYNKK